jgi:hypothetical protein
MEKGFSYFQNILSGHPKAKIMALGTVVLRWFVRMMALGTLDLAFMRIMGVGAVLLGLLRKLTVISMALQTGGHGGLLLRRILLVASFAGDPELFVPVTEEKARSGRRRSRLQARRPGPQNQKDQPA